MSRFRIDAEAAFPLYRRSPPGRASSGRTNFLAVTMFAVIKTGGKQYRVAKDDVIVVEKLAGDAGSKITFSDVLMSGDGKTVKLGKDLSGGHRHWHAREDGKGRQGHGVQEAPPQHLSPQDRSSSDREPREDHRHRGKSDKE